MDFFLGLGLFALGFLASHFRAEIWDGIRAGVGRAWAKVRGL